MSYAGSQYKEELAFGDTRTDVVQSATLRVRFCVPVYGR
jgi:hypothetical protein